MKASEFQEMVIGRLTSIERDITHHIRRTDILEQLVVDYEKRIREFEKLNNFLTISGRILIIGAALAGIAKLFLT